MNQAAAPAKRHRGVRGVSFAKRIMLGSSGNNTDGSGTYDDRNDSS